MHNSYVTNTNFLNREKKKFPKETFNKTEVEFKMNGFIKGKLDDNCAFDIQIEPTQENEAGTYTMYIMVNDTGSDSQKIARIPDQIEAFKTTEYIQTI